MNIHIFLFCCLIKKTERRRRAGRKTTISHRGEWWSRVEWAATSPWQLIYRRDASGMADGDDEGLVASTGCHSPCQSVVRKCTQQRHRTAHKDQSLPLLKMTSVSPSHFPERSQMCQLKGSLTRDLTISPNTGADTICIRILTILYAVWFNTVIF
jgi:hypothetical protein